MTGRELQAYMGRILGSGSPLGLSESGSGSSALTEAGRSQFTYPSLRAQGVSTNRGGVIFFHPLLPTGGSRMPRRVTLFLQGHGGGGGQGGGTHKELQQLKSAS